MERRAGPSFLEAPSHRRKFDAGKTLSALSDIEETSKDGKLEDVVMHDRWAKNGAGRADVQISGGSVPMLVKATECWSALFERSYYTDSAGLASTVGDPAACAFPDAK